MKEKYKEQAPNRYDILSNTENEDKSFEQSKFDNESKSEYSTSDEDKSCDSQDSSKSDDINSLDIDKYIKFNDKNASNGQDDD